MNPTVINVSEIDAVDRAAMFALLDHCFVGVTRKQFESDLYEKTLAVLLHSDAGKLLGFSTLLLYPAMGPTGEQVTIACSGDSIVAPEAWGSSALSRTWISAARGWHQQHGTGDLYWLLITSGFRTYRFLPVFFRSYFPHVNQPTPTHIREWVHTLAYDRWGKQYDPQTDIVRFDHPQVLRMDLANVPEGRQTNPHVAHFLELNPQHDAGDELVCLCSLDEENLTAAGRRMLRAGRRTLLDPLEEITH